MKISKSNLIRIIKEELGNILMEQDLKKMFQDRGLDMKKALGSTTPEEFIARVKLGKQTLDQALDAIVAKEKGRKKRGLKGMLGSKPRGSAEGFPLGSVTTATKG